MGIPEQTRAHVAAYNTLLDRILDKDRHDVLQVMEHFLTSQDQQGTLTDPDTPEGNQ